MIYTPEYSPEEKRHVEAILAAFRDYIAQNPHFDILCSEKCGYLYLSLEDLLVPFEPRLSADDLLAHLFCEISSDVRDLFLCGEHFDLFLYPDEIEEVCARVKPYINQLPDAYQSHGKASLEFFLKHCNERSQRI